MNTPVTSKGCTHRIRSLILADDDTDDHDFFYSVLHEVDPTIRLNIVRDGLELTQLLSSYVPDLLVLDLEMPRKNGLECLREIRSVLELGALPVVVFSTTARPSNIETAYALGAHLYLTKPSSYTDLRSCVRALLALDWSDPAGVKKHYRVNNSYTVLL